MPKQNEGTPFEIRIESILGGLSEYDAFCAKDEYNAARGIDSDLPPFDNSSPTGVWGFIKTSGLIRPTPVVSLGTLTSPIRWLVSDPKNTSAASGGVLWAYSSNGSVATHNGSSFTSLSDGGSMSLAAGNGAEYYDNYIYFAKNTTIARYGPLNGTPSFNGDYWGVTLGKAALTDTSYPGLDNSSTQIPNHVMKRHSDGKLYIADVVDNKGTLHMISTTKTTVEGDTDNGSTFQVLEMGYGLWPTAIESYGNDIAVALFEGYGIDSLVSNSTFIRKPAKIVFWDTISQRVSKIVEFPDPIITAMKTDPVTGVLYVFSGLTNADGCRISTFVGGYSFQQVGYAHESLPPFAGAVDAGLNRIYFGGNTGFYNASSGTSPVIGCVWAIGSSVSRTPKKIYNVLGSQVANSLTTAIKLAFQTNPAFLSPVMATWDTGSTITLESLGSNNGTYNSVWESGLFRIGKNFKVHSVRVPFYRVGTNTCYVTPSLHIDGASARHSLATISSTSYTGHAAKLRANGVAGENDLLLRFGFEGTSTFGSGFSVGLPIIIRGETFDND